MKRSLLLLLSIFTLASCSKSDSAPVEDVSGFTIAVKRNTKSSTGVLTANNANAAAIHIWKADGKDLSVKSVAEAAQGNAYDNTAKAYVTADYTFVNTSSETQNVAPGNYFIFVILDNNQTGGGNLAFSYTTFTVKEGEITNATKIFASSTTNAAYQLWSKQD
jgi:hypothetical protein